MILLCIKEYRKKKGITQDALAARIGINRATISKYESGAISPPMEQIVKIAQVLNTPLIDILGIRPNEKTKQDNALLTDEIIKFLAVHQTEVDMFRKFRCLDERGKSAVLRVLDCEYDVLHRTSGTEGL